MVEDKSRKEEEHLKDALEYSDAIIATVREPFVVLDKEFKIITANRSFYRTFQVNPEETENQLIYELGNHQWDIPMLRKLLENILPMNKVFEDYEVEHDFESIGRKTMLLNARKIHRETDHVEMILLAIEDITVRKKAEDDMETLNEALEKKNKELEEVINITSHDMRSPLISVIGFSKSLEKDLKDISSLIESNKVSVEIKEMLSPFISDIAESTEYICSSALNMEALLAGLSKVLRIGYVALTKEQLDMNILISDVINVISYQMKEAEVKLEISELPPCFGDKDQINQLFSNILGHALKYLDPHRSGVIRVSGYKDNKHSVYCVEDNGIGISSDKHEKIFEIFHQIEPSKQKGQGLGLATVLRIIYRHNGDVWLKSDLGKGSKFFISLPSKKF